MAEKKKDPLDKLDPRFKTLHAFCSAVDKKFGRGAIGTAAENLILDIPRITTGSMALDHALGGGVPARRMSMFFGKKSAGKSTTAMMVVGHAQKLCRNCFRPAQDMKVKSVIVERAGDKREMFYAEAFCDCYAAGVWKPSRFKFYDEKKDVYLDEPEKDFKARLKKLKENSFEEMICGLLDVEGTHDRDWTESLGVDNRRLMYYRPETAEECIDMYDPWVRTGSVDFLVLDTVAFLTPSVEVEKSAQEWQQGLQARLISKFCRKMNSALIHGARCYGRQVTQIWCNQVRMNIGPFGGEVMPGGLAQGFTASTEIKFKPDKPEVEKMNTGKKGEELFVPLWIDIKFKCVKNKVAPGGIESYYRLILTDTETKRKGQVSEDEQVWRWARYYTLVGKYEDDELKDKKDKSKKWYYHGREGTQEYRTFAEIQAMVMESPEELAWMKKSIMMLMLGKVDV